MVMVILVRTAEEAETGLQWAKDWMEEEEAEVETVFEVLCSLSPPQWGKVGTIPPEMGLEL